MSPLGDVRKVATRRPAWQTLLVVVAICSLTVSLSTRTFRLKISHSNTVQSGAGRAIRQHMDRDAVRWVPAVPLVAVLDAPAFYPLVAPAGPPLPGLLLDESLYNRPPPA